MAKKRAAPFWGGLENDNGYCIDDVCHYQVGRVGRCAALYFFVYDESAMFCDDQRCAVLLQTRRY
jgi:hypothetical protein